MTDVAERNSKIPFASGSSIARRERFTLTRTEFEILLLLRWHAKSLVLSVTDGGGLRTVQSCASEPTKTYTKQKARKEAKQFGKKETLLISILIEINVVLTEFLLPLEPHL